MASITVNQAEIAEVQRLLGDLKDKYKSVMTTSINKALTTANTQTAARVGNKVNLKAARIKQDFKIKKANYGDISGQLSALDSTKNRVGLIQYSARQTSKGVTVQVLRTSQRTLLKHAFIARGKKSSKEHVFWRENRPAGTGRWPVGQKARAAWSAVDPRYKRPLSRRVGPSVAYWFSKPDIFDPVSIQAQHVYLINVENKIDEIIRRHRG